MNIADQWKAVGKQEGLAFGIAVGKAEGKAEGIAKGKAEGRTEALRHVIRLMYRNGVAVEDISKNTALSVDEILAMLDSNSSRDKDAGSAGCG